MKTASIYTRQLTILMLLLLLSGCAPLAAPSGATESTAVVSVAVPTAEAPYAGFQVQGRHLYDAQGEKVVLIGINKMVIWTDLDGLPAFPEIAKTGANAVRIVWLTSGSARELDVAITNAIKNELIPVVDCHDATGDWSKFDACIDYWVRSDVLTVLQKHEPYLIVNIANEPVEGYLPNAEYSAGYELGIKRLRGAGIRVPLVVDAMDYGKDIDGLQKNGPYLVAADPLHNLIFSIHMYWASLYYGYKVDEFVTKEIAESVKLELPLIVGEYASVVWQCGCCVPYTTILEQAHLNEIGHFPWSWGPGNQDCADMDMTEDGYFNTLHGWGQEVALTDPYSIQNTSVRPASIVAIAEAKRAEDATPLDAPAPSDEPLPDLVIEDIRWTPAEAVKGDDLLLEVQVKNVGDAPTPAGKPVRVIFQVKGQTVSWSDTFSNSIAPDETVVIAASGSPDGNEFWTDAIPGKLIFFAWVDPIGARLGDENEPLGQWENVILEADENNNMFVKIGTVALK